MDLDERYDIIVIGAGSGGLNIASFMNKAGFKTLLIDKSDSNIGGDCLNFGCVPSKALIHVSRLAAKAKEAKKFGLKVSGSVNLSKAANYVKKKKDVIRVHENADYFKGQGMDVVLGMAKFTGPRSVEVAGKEYYGKVIVLATGSRPRKLSVPGFEKVKSYTNETIFDLKKLPKKFLFIGGGPIGIELGQAFQRMGSQVTVVQRGSQFLPKEDLGIARVLYQRLKGEGMKFHFNSKPVEFTSAKTLVVEDDKGKKSKISFDAVFVGIGRDLNIEGLDLEKAGIKLDKSGKKLKVDSYLRTTNRNVFVCGDIAGSYMFTHAAELHASVILNNFFSPIKKKWTNDKLSWVTFTDPEIATFGLNEAELMKRRIKYDKLHLGFEHDDRAIVDENTDSKMVLYVSKKGKLLGGSMVTENAGEIFQELVLANSADLDIKQIFNKIYPYPTASRVNKRIISEFYSNKLTDFSKRLLKLLFG